MDIWSQKHCRPAITSGEVPAQFKLSSWVNKLVVQHGVCVMHMWLNIAYTPGMPHKRRIRRKALSTT